MVDVSIEAVGIAATVNQAIKSLKRMVCASGSEILQGD